MPEPRIPPSQVPQLGIQISKQVSASALPNLGWHQATSTGANELDQALVLMKGFSQFGQTTSRLAARRDASVRGSLAAQGKLTAAEYITQVEQGVADDGSNQFAFPPTLVVTADGEEVNPWATPEEPGLENDPLYQAAWQTAYGLSDGIDPAGQQAFMHAFVQDVYPAWVEHRVKLQREFDENITGGLIQGAVSGHFDSASDLYDSARNDLGQEGMPFSGSNLEITNSVILPAAKIAIAQASISGDFETAEQLVLWAEDGDPEELSKLTVGLHDARVAHAEQESFGRITSLTNFMLHTGSGPMPPAWRIAEWFGFVDDPRSHVAQNLLEAWSLAGGDDSETARRRFETSLQTYAQEAADDGEFYEAINVLRGLMETTVTLPNGSQGVLAPAGSQMRLIVMGVISNLDDTGSDRVAAVRTENEFQVTGRITDWYQAGNNPDTDLDKDGVPDLVQEFRGQFPAAEAGQYIKKARDLWRTWQLDVVESEEAQREWADSLYAMRTATNDDARKTIYQGVVEAVIGGRLMASRISEIAGELGTEAKYDEWRTHPEYLATQDAISDQVMSVISAGERPGIGGALFTRPEFAQIEIGLDRLLSNMDREWRTWYRQDVIQNAISEGERDYVFEQSQRAVEDIRRRYWTAARNLVAEVIGNEKATEILTDQAWPENYPDQVDVEAPYWAQPATP